MTIINQTQKKNGSLKPCLNQGFHQHNYHIQCWPISTFI